VAEGLQSRGLVAGDLTGAGAERAATLEAASNRRRRRWKEDIQPWQVLMAGLSSMMLYVCELISKLSK